MSLEIGFSEAEQVVNKVEISALCYTISVGAS